MWRLGFRCSVRRSVCTAASPPLPRCSIAQKPHWMPFARIQCGFLPESIIERTGCTRSALNVFAGGVIDGDHRQRVIIVAGNDIAVCLHRKAFMPYSIPVFDRYPFSVLQPLQVKGHSDFIGIKISRCISGAGSFSCGGNVDRCSNLVEINVVWLNLGLVVRLHGGGRHHADDQGQYQNGDEHAGSFFRFHVVLSSYSMK